MKQLNFRGHHAAGVAQASEAFFSAACMEAVAQRSRARGTLRSLMWLRRSVRDRQHREQPLDEAEVILFLKRPNTSSHGFTLGLCDSLA
jgi:hypothetical protein